MSDLYSINATYFALSTMAKIMVVTFDNDGVIKLSTSGIGEAFRLLSHGPYMMYTHHLPQQGSLPILYIFKQEVEPQFGELMAYINEAQKKKLEEQQAALDALKKGQHEENI